MGDGDASALAAYRRRGDKLHVATWNACSPGWHRTDAIVEHLDTKVGGGACDLYYVQEVAVAAAQREAPGASHLRWIVREARPWDTEIGLTQKWADRIIDIRCTEH